MSVTQKALIIRVGPEKQQGVDDLNIELRRGWRVVHTTPLGGTGLNAEGQASEPFLAALVIIEHRGEEKMAATAEATEEEEEANRMEEIVEGDGAETELPDEPTESDRPNASLNVPNL